eukprot:gene15157-biopygen7068
MSVGSGSGSGEGRRGPQICARPDWRPGRSAGLARRPWRPSAGLPGRGLPWQTYAVCNLGGDANVAERSGPSIDSSKVMGLPQMTILHRRPQGNASGGPLAAGPAVQHSRRPRRPWSGSRSEGESESERKFGARGCVCVRGHVIACVWCVKLGAG